MFVAVTYSSALAAGSIGGLVGGFVIVGGMVFLMYAYVILKHMTPFPAFLKRIAQRREQNQQATRTTSDQEPTRESGLALASPFDWSSHSYGLP
jgi:hypothetical protein